MDLEIRVKSDRQHRLSHVSTLYPHYSLHKEMFKEEEEERGGSGKMVGEGRRLLCFTDCSHSIPRS